MKKSPLGIMNTDFIQGPVCGFQDYLFVNQLLIPHNYVKINEYSP